MQSPYPRPSVYMVHCLREVSADYLRVNTSFWLSIIGNDDSSSSFVVNCWWMMSLIRARNVLWHTGHVRDCSWKVCWVQETIIFQLMLLVCLLLFYAKATVFQLYHGSDMIYEMRRRKPEPTLLPTQGFFNLPHHTGMVWEELGFDDAREKPAFRRLGHRLR